MLNPDVDGYTKTINLKQKMVILKQKKNNKVILKQ